MAKIKTSGKQRKFDWDMKKLAKCREWNPTKELLDKERLGRVIMECLLDNDPNGVVEALQSYLYAVNISKFTKQAKVPRMTLYNALKNKNPTIKTLAKVLHNVAA